MIPGIFAGAAMGGGGGGGDPDFSTVISLLNMATDFTDAKGKTWTPSGASVVSGEAVFDGVNDYVFTPNATDWDFGSGAFTVEGFLETSSSGNQVFIGKRNGAGYSPFGIGLFSGKLQILMSTTGSTWAATNADTNNFPLNTPQHVALCRSGTNVYLLRNGSVVASTTVSGALMTSSDAVIMGSWGTSSFPLAGKVKAFRANKGVARYTGSYTVPSLPFPTS